MRERGIADLAGLQHGVLLHGQLLERGITAGAIKDRVAAGRLHPVHRGVYALGHASLSPHGSWMAGVLAGGLGAVLSHRSAAAMWGLVQQAPRRCEVTAPSQHRLRANLILHRGTVAPEDVRRRNRIAVTSVPRTLIDLAAVVHPLRLQSAVNEAEVLALATRTELEDAIRSHRGRRGVARLRAVLEIGYGGPVRGELETRFLRAVERACLPLPETGAILRLDASVLECDCVWRDVGLIVELDGRAFHDTAIAFERDRSRDRALAAAGWRVVRVTWDQLHRQPDLLIADLRRLLSGRE